MNEQNNLILARATFNTLCQFFDSRNWSYERDDEELLINCSACGEDLSMPISVKLYSDRQVAVLISHLPFDIPEEKRVEFAVAVCAINDYIIHGGFDYDIKSGSVYFRMSNCFVQSVLSEEVFDYLVLCSCATIDEYNDKLLMLAKGVISLEQLIESLSQK